MALLDVCGISDWVKEDTFNPESASVDRVNHFNFAAREPELAVPIGVDPAEFLKPLTESEDGVEGVKIKLEHGTTTLALNFSTG